MKISFFINRRRKELALRKWHKWFAWYPVAVDGDCDFRWFEYVGRLKRHLYGDSWFVYCSLDEYESKTPDGITCAIEPFANGMYSVSAYNPSKKKHFCVDIQYSTTCGWVFDASDHEDGCYVYAIHSKKQEEY